MKDYNKALEKAYKTKIAAAIAPVKYFLKFAPDNIAGDAYVVLSLITGADSSTKDTFDFRISAQVQIYSKLMLAAGMAPENDINNLGEKIKNAIYPSRSQLLDLGPEFQVISTTIDNDISAEPFFGDAFVYLNRNISFTHLIYIKQ